MPQAAVQQLHVQLVYFKASVTYIWMVSLYVILTVSSAVLILIFAIAKSHRPLFLQSSRNLMQIFSAIFRGDSLYRLGRCRQDTNPYILCSFLLIKSVRLCLSLFISRRTNECAKQMG